MFKMNMVVLAVVAACVTSGVAKTVNLEDLEIEHIRQGWGVPHAGQSVTGRPLTMQGHKYQHGLGTHARAVINLEFDGKAERLQAVVGVDDDVGNNGSIAIRAVVDGKTANRYGPLHGGGEPARIDIDLTGVHSLTLIVDPAGDGVDYDHADFADAVITYSGSRPKMIPPPGDEKVILTPAAPDSPQINGPLVYGVRPGHEFLYRIPCTGIRPMKFKVDGLPEGLTLDTRSGIIRGTIKSVEKRTYKTLLTAVNRFGSDSREFSIKVGDTLALTPPMGWNSWYIHYHRISEKMMREAARTMIASGMADYGYQYVNIDDCWMKKKGDTPYRTEAGAALPNRKFPDIKGMVNEIHRLGLKAGLYTSPGPWTCAGYVGAYRHEQAEVDQYVEWGFDFLKYDWCSYGQVATGSGREKFIRPYRLMGGMLQQAPRDIVYNLCQYGMGNVWEWGREIGGNCSRTTGDLGLTKRGGLPGFYAIGLRNAEHYKYAGPGYWNDPDYILIGWVGDPFGMGEGTPTKLTGNEQYSYMSMWCMMAAPLIFSGDMEKLDAFTLNILCNREVIAVDQDPLGKQARIVKKNDQNFVMVKEMADGSLVVGIFNIDEFEQKVSFKWQDLGSNTKYRVRDLWRQKDEPDTEDGEFSTTIPRHGVKLIRLFPQTK